MTPPITLASELQKLGFSSKTVTQYLREIYRADSWCQARGYPLSTAPADLVARYVESRPRTWASRKITRSAIGHYWTIVRRRKPPLGVLRVPPKPKAVCRALEEDEARILAKAARERGDLKGLATALGLYQALRREEIARLRWSDFHGGDMTVVGKFDRQRTIPVHDKVLVMLAAARPATLPLAVGPGGYLFPGRFGGHCSPATIWTWIREVGDEAGVPAVTPHRLRHTCLATQNDNNGDLTATQEFAGHSRPETTAGYTRVRARAVRAAMESVDY